MRDVHRDRVDSFIPLPWAKGIVVDELNRDLVVSILAVLTDTIPREALAEVLNSWSQHRQTPLAQVLRQASGLDDGKFRELESLATIHLKVHHNDVRQSLASLNAHALTVNVLTEIDDDGLRLTLSKTLGCDATLPFDQGEAPPGSAQPSQAIKGERFQLIRPHASGGIGQVWLAPGDSSSSATWLSRRSSRVLQSWPTNEPDSCSRRRSPAAWSTRASFPCTAWERTPMAVPTTLCVLSAARASRSRSGSFTRSFARMPDRLQLARGSHRNGASSFASSSAGSSTFAMRSTTPTVAA